MKIIFDEEDKSGVLIRACTFDFFSALFNIGGIIRRERNKDELTKEELIEKIKEEIPEIIHCID